MAPKKPKAPKIPAVIAKPAAKPAQSINLYGSPATNTRPSTTSQKKTTTTGKKTTGGGTSSFDKQFKEGMKQIKKDKTELQRLIEEYNKGLLGGGEDTGGGEEEGGGEDPALAYAKMQDEKARRRCFCST
jgi:hypothetical protein